MNKYLLVSADGGLFVENRHPSIRAGNITEVIFQQLKETLVEFQEKHSDIQVPSDDVIRQSIGNGTNERASLEAWVPQYQEEIWSAYLANDQTRTKKQFVSIDGMKELVQSCRQKDMMILVVSFRDPKVVTEILKNLSYTCEVLSKESSQQPLDLHVVPTDTYGQYRMPSGAIWDGRIKPYLPSIKPEETVALVKESGDLGLAKAVGLWSLFMRYERGDLSRIMGDADTKIQVTPDQTIYEVSQIPELLDQYFDKRYVEEMTPRLSS